MIKLILQIAALLAVWFMGMAILTEQASAAEWVEGNTATHHEYSISCEREVVTSCVTLAVGSLDFKHIVVDERDIHYVHNGDYYVFYNVEVVLTVWVD